MSNSKCPKIAWLRLATSVCDTTTCQPAPKNELLSRDVQQRALAKSLAICVSLHATPAVTVISSRLISAISRSHLSRQINCDKRDWERLSRAVTALPRAVICLLSAVDGFLPFLFKRERQCERRKKSFTRAVVVVSRKKRESLDFDFFPLPIRRSPCLQFTFDA